MREEFVLSGRLKKTCEAKSERGFSLVRRETENVQKHKHPDTVRKEAPGKDGLGLGFRTITERPFVAEEKDP